MKKSISTRKTEYFISGIFERYFKGKSLAVFDIETMGLNPRINEVVLAAIMNINSDGTATITQYILDSLEEEALLLAILQKELNKYDVLLTYNGRHFDLPFINTRAEILGTHDIALRNYEITAYDLDLYLVLSGHSVLKRTLPNLKQKTVEEYMGLADSRDDDISGAESVALFKEYFLTGDLDYRKDLMQKILLHNHDDVLQLYKLLPVIKQTDFHEAMSALGFTVNDIYSVCAVKFSGASLNISGTHKLCGQSYVSFISNEKPYEIEIKKDGTFKINVPLKAVKSSFVLNLRETDLDENEFKQYGNYVNGYLILGNAKAPNSLEINVLTKALVSMLPNSVQ